MQSSSESKTSSSERDDSSNPGVNTWVKQEKIPNLGIFSGNPRIKQIPSDPTKVSEITELFFGNHCFQMLCEGTNLYNLQNQEKYSGTCKGLKWSDVNVAEMKKFFAIIKK